MAVSMLCCTALRGLLAVSCLAVTPAVIPGVLAADPAGVEHQQAMAVAPDLSQGTFQVMPASEVVPVTLPASAAPIWQGAQAFWQKRWRADTARLKRLHVDGART